MKGTLWHPSNCSKLNICTPRWIHNSPSFRNFIKGPLHKRDYKVSIQDLITKGSWDMSKMSFDLPNDLSIKIKATPTPAHHTGKNYTTWDISTNGSFTTKSC